MSESVFVHLRVHSAYSLAEGAIKIPDLAQICERRKVPAVALTDSHNLFGALEFSSRLSKAGVQPIIGCHLFFEPLYRKDPTRPLEEDERDRITVLVKDETGYRNLMKLVSQSWILNKERGLTYTTYADLSQYHEGLIVLSGGTTGTLGKCLKAKETTLAKNHIQEMKSLFCDRYYIEITRLGLIEEEAIEDQLIDLAYEYELPLVATNPAYFLEEKLFEAHDALQCIAQGRYVNEMDRPRLNPHFRFKTAEEMVELFKDLPEAIQNTYVIAQRCAFMVEGRKPLLPRYPCETSEEEELKRQAFEGLKIRLENQVYKSEHTEEERATIKKTYEDRLVHELKIIQQMGFPGYFLIVADFVKWAKEHHIPVGPGRGSGAGSLVAWSLTITDIDPIRFQLIFERFLNPERVSMPDFDIDFCQDRRDEVIAYVCRRYGTDRVAQIITFGKLQAKAVIRDVGRVLQMPYGQVDKISKLIPGTAANPATLEEALEQEPELRRLQQSDETVKKLLEIGMNLEGLYRHASTHAAGIVISDRPLDELVALYQDSRSDLPATQFNMKDVEKAGLVKFDFLGLKTLTVMAKVAEFVNRAGGHLKIESIPLDDKKTFDLLNRCLTIGIFQIESQGMTDVLRRLRPERFEELVALVALYRPGPMDDIPRYLACRHGEQEADFLHPMLQGILKETFGVMVYQEQVMQIAQVMAGYSAGAADLLRRAMGKKVKEEMDQQRAIFVNGAKNNGVQEELAHEIFDRMAKFASYGFNKSHSAPYALISYQTAYLKAHYPVEFYAAHMTYEMHHVEKLDIFRQDMRHFQIELLPPDINYSFPAFAVESRPDGTKHVRYALGAIKNVGETAMEGIVQERERNGLFKDIWDFAARVDSKLINKRLLEHLIWAGAFDSIHSNRHQLYQSIEMITAYAQTSSQEKASVQSTLFGSIESYAPHQKMVEVKDWSQSERLSYEYQAIGYYLTAHPLEVYRDDIAPYNITLSSAIESAVKGEETCLKLFGIVTAKKERISKKGTKFAFVSFSDYAGSYEVAFFSETLHAYRSLLESGEPLLLDVNARRDEENIRMIALEARLLEEHLRKGITELNLEISCLEQLQQIKEILETCSSGECRITLQVYLKQHQLMILLPQTYGISPRIKQELLIITRQKEATA